MAVNQVTLLLHFFKHPSHYCPFLIEAMGALSPSRLACIGTAHFLVNIPWSVVGTLKSSYKIPAELTQKERESCVVAWFEQILSKVDRVPPCSPIAGGQHITCRILLYNHSAVQI